MTKEEFKLIRKETGLCQVVMGMKIKALTGKGSRRLVQKMEQGVQPIQLHTARAVKLIKYYDGDISAFRQDLHDELACCPERAKGIIDIISILK